MDLLASRGVPAGGDAAGAAPHPGGSAPAAAARPLVLPAHYRRALPGAGPCTEPGAAVTPARRTQENGISCSAPTPPRCGSSSQSSFRRRTGALTSACRCASSCLPPAPIVGAPRAGQPAEACASGSGRAAAAAGRHSSHMAARAAVRGGHRGALRAAPAAAGAPHGPFRRRRPAPVCLSPTQPAERRRAAACKCARCSRAACWQPRVSAWRGRQQALCAARPALRATSWQHGVWTLGAARAGAQVFVDLCRRPVADYLQRFGFRSDLLRAMYAVTDGVSGLAATWDMPGSGLNFLCHNMVRGRVAAPCLVSLLSAHGMLWAAGKMPCACRHAASARVSPLWHKCGSRVQQHPVSAVSGARASAACRARRGPGWWSAAAWAPSAASWRRCGPPSRIALYAHRWHCMPTCCRRRPPPVRHQGMRGRAGGGSASRHARARRCL